MAKQIYVDENGNEHLVSGTINTASMLPISAQDNTGTKDYIDNSLKNQLTKIPVSATTNSQGSVDSNNIMTGGMALSDYLIVGIIPTTSLHAVVIGNYNGRYVFEIVGYTDFNPVVSSATTFDIYAIRLT